VTATDPLVRRASLLDPGGPYPRAAYREWRVGWKATVEIAEDGFLAHNFAFDASAPTRFRALVTNVVSEGVSLDAVLVRRENQLVSPLEVFAFAPDRKEQIFCRPMGLTLPTLNTGDRMVVTVKVRRNPWVMELLRGPMVDGLPLFALGSKRAEECELLFLGEEREA